VPTTSRRRSGAGSGIAAGRRGAALDPKIALMILPKILIVGYMNVNVRIERTFWLRAAANYIAKAK
jgi:hypothetical protein